LAIIGAGWLGREVARRASAEGHRVVATTRSGAWGGDGQAPEEVEIVALDVLRDESRALRSLLGRVEVAVFCYAPSSDQDRRQLYVEGAAAICRACGEAGLERVVYTSSTSALADTDGWVDEESPDWPDGRRGRIQRDAEECVRAGLEADGTPWIVLRLAGLYGPGRTLADIYRVADTDRVRPGDGLERTNLVHRDDAASAVLAAIRLPASESGLIHVCDDDHRPRRMVAAEVARAAGFPPPGWAENVDGRSPRGKQVRNEKMKAVLRVTLLHPTHVVE